MLERALRARRPGAVRIGVASHNLFEIAWALTVAEPPRRCDRIEIEMLEGMAPPQSRAVREAAGELLLYAPVVAKADREASIAYLSRRLDENSSPENFLRSLFDIAPGSPAWHARGRRASVHRCRDRHGVNRRSRRTQDRARRAPRRPADAAFANAVDTDFTRPVEPRVDRRRARRHAPPSEPTLVDDRRRGRRVVVAQARARSEQWVDDVVDRAPRGLLPRIADVMEAERGATLALMARTAGKTVAEGDPEVSEAVDFARYAAHLTLAHERLDAGTG